jgi:hypothetical protein
MGRLKDDVIDAAGRCDQLIGRVAERDDTPEIVRRIRSRDLGSCVLPHAWRGDNVRAHSAIQAH